MNEQQNYLDHIQEPVKNAVATLVLGILSIISCWLYGIPSLILSIIALAISSKSNRDYLADPTMYDRSTYNQLKAGRICAIVGLSLSAVFWLILIIGAMTLLRY